MTVETKRELMETAEVAELLGVKPSTLNWWRCRRQGPAYVKVGGKLVRYRRSDVESWLLDGRRREPARVS